MDKEEFNLLTVGKQVLTVNNLLKDNTLTNACKIIGIARSTIHGRFKKAQYEFKDGLYVKGINTPVIENKLMQSVTDPMNNVLDMVAMDKYIETRIKKVLENQQNYNSKIEEIYEWYSKEKNIIDIPKLEIDDRCFGEYKTRSFEVYSNILNDFIQFCNEKPFTKRQLISQAILEFINKYK